MVGNPVRSLLLDIVASAGEDPEATVDAILIAVAGISGIRYDGAEDALALATTHGRVIMTIASDPTITRRAISVYLDISEAKVGKVISELVIAGYVSRHRVGRGIKYDIQVAEILKNPDSKHLLACVKALGADPALSETEATPRTPRH